MSETDVRIEWDSELEEYYVVVDVKEIGPLTDGELKELQRCLNAHFN